MLRFDLENENETIRNYRERVRQCEALGEYALAEQIRAILVQEQEHQIDLATALGVDVPDVTRAPKRARSQADVTAAPRRIPRPIHRQSNAKRLATIAFLPSSTGSRRAGSLPSRGNRSQNGRAWPHRSAHFQGSPTVQRGDDRFRSSATSARTSPTAGEYLKRSPGLAAMAVMTLALGIGANVTVFTLANAFLFKNLPFADSARILYVSGTLLTRSGSVRSLSYRTSWSSGIRPERSMAWRHSRTGRWISATRGGSPNVTVAR